MNVIFPIRLPAALLVLASLSAGASAQALDEARDCLIAPHQVVEVSSALPGLLAEVNVERSDTVQAGQLVARLESRVERASLELARTWAGIDSEVRIEETAGALDRRRNDRITQLYASQAIALDDKDRAQTEAKLSALRLRQAREKRWIRTLDARKAEAALERRAVRSPIDGVVVERYRSAGEYVENQPILRIARLDPLEVETVLPMALFGTVDAGMVAEISAENVPQATQRAVVRIVDRVGDAASGTFGVRLTLPNPDHHIPAGLRCTLRFVPGARAELPGSEPADGGEGEGGGEPDEPRVPVEPSGAARSAAMHGPDARSVAAVPAS